MILLSRSLERNGMRAVLLAALLSAVPACEKTCGLVGCPEGLWITFAGNFTSAATFDIVISMLTPTPDARFRIATCTLVKAGWRQRPAVL